MRVRIRRDPKDIWLVEEKQWWDFSWRYVESFYGDNSEKRAIEFSRKLIDPVIIEITRGEP